MAELEKRIARGEIVSPPELSQEVECIIRDTLPAMTPSERDFIQRTQLQAHELGARILAEHGRPVPGNDPAKPN